MAFGKPELTKEQLDAATIPELTKHRIGIGAELDQLINRLGELYGQLIQLHTAVGRKVIYPAVLSPNTSHIPQWISEHRNAELFRNRLAMELAEHSSGGGRESILGPVYPSDSLEAVFAAQHAVEVKGRG
jgi:hypothetical protein